MERNLQDFRVRRREPAPPHSVLGQFSYAPTTQTTVVTTTTTTTTSFPPLLLRAPQHLQERDPELYPLALLPTPQSIKKLQFDLDGKVTNFEEADDTQQRLTELERSNAILQTHGGVLREVTTSEVPMEKPGRISKYEPQQRPVSRRGDQCEDFASHRDSTPVSFSEMTELQGLHPRSRRPRTVLPRLQTQRSHPLSNEQVYDTLSETESFSESTQSFDEDSQGPPAYFGPRSAEFMSSIPSRTTGIKAPEGFRLAPPSHHMVAGSTTPPDTETETSYFHGNRTSPDVRHRSAGLSVLTTSPIQGASLPSPSLSPITAAANLRTATSDRPTASQRLPAIPPSDLLEAQLTTAFASERSPFQASNPDVPKAQDTCHNDFKLSSPSLMDIPSMIDSFDVMPDAVKTYVIYQLLRRCSKKTLLLVADVVNPALRCDFLSRLPLELSLNILKYFDVKTMCRAAQVSKKWRHIVNSDEKAWKDLLDAAGFQIQGSELERAVREGWGWQCAVGAGEWEKDLRQHVELRRRDSTIVDSLPSRPTSREATADSTDIRVSPKRKRKMSSKPSSFKRQKRTSSSTPQLQAGSWMQILEKAVGPNAFASAAAAAVPYPQIGLPSLVGLHLFKSIYQRHHLIRKSWMDPSTKPLHLAFRAHQRHVVTCLQFDSERILTGSDDSNIDIYDTKTGASLKRLEGHEGGVWALEYQGNILVSGSTDRSVRVWNMAEGRCLQVFQGHTSTVRCLQILQPVQVGQKQDGTPIMMPRYPLIITGSRDSSCRVWKLPRLEDKPFFQTGAVANDTDNPYFLRTLIGHHHSVRAIAAYADVLVSGSYDTTVRVWKISTGECVHRLQGHAQKVYSVVLDHARGRCMSGSMDSLVKVWSLETGSCLFNLEGHTSLVGLLDLKDDCLVSAAADSALRIWDPEYGRCRHILSAHTGAITCFAHDGQKVISGSDRTLKMWNTKTGQCIRDLLTDLSGVWQIKFDDRRCIAAVHRNNWTYIEVLDFGANRDGVPESERGRRKVVDRRGREIVDEAEVIDEAFVDDLVQVDRIP